MTVALQIDSLFKRFGEQQVLNGFSLQVARGEVVGLLGPNGCGKSTVLNIICQLLQADAGQVQLMGQPMIEQSADVRARIGYCAQESALYPDLFPQENIQFFARLYGVPAEQRTARVAELMERFGLVPYAATRAGLLSGGWQQRLSLAVALVHRPELLVLDEPTVAVDVEARMDLWRLIEGLRDSGTTILLTSHHLAEAERLYAIAQTQVPDYTSWYLEYVYFTLACREKLSGRLSEADLALAARAIAQGQFLLKRGYSQTGLTERHCGRLHQLRGEWAEAIPLLLAARPRLAAEDLVACDQALVLSYAKTGDRRAAEALIAEGALKGGRFAPLYDRMRATLSVPDAVSPLRTVDPGIKLDASGDTP